MTKSSLIGIIFAVALFIAAPALAYTPSQGDLIKAYGKPAMNQHCYWNLIKVMHS